MSHSIGPVETRFFEYHDPERPLELRVGGSLPRFTLAYEMYGRMNEDRSNVILLYHAMTGSQHAAGINHEVPGLDGRWTEELHEGWWNGFVGPEKALDTRHFCVVCANYLGGCYGSTGPASINPETGTYWGPSFPVLRMSDIVDAQMKLLDHLGVEQLHAVAGASIGGFLSLLTAQLKNQTPLEPVDNESFVNGAKPAFGDARRGLCAGCEVERHAGNVGVLALHQRAVAVDTGEQTNWFLFLHRLDLGAQDVTFAQHDVVPSCEFYDWHVVLQVLCADPFARLQAGINSALVGGHFSSPCVCAPGRA